MRVKMFSAPTMAQAMEDVRLALGPDAIIISTYEARRGRGVEIRAAVERRSGPAQIIRETDIAEISPGALKPAPPPASGKKAAARPAGKTVRHLQPLRKALVAHGFSRRLGHALLAACDAVRAPDLPEALARVIDMRFSMEPIPCAPARPLMLVGGPGVGKTATTAKLAARAVMQGLETHIITTDTLRTGAIDQLGALAQVMKHTVAAADTPGALQDIAEKMAPKAGRAACMVIDTPATNPYNPKEIEDLTAFARAADAEPVLVMAAGHEGAELIETIKAYRPLNITRVIATRFDAARRLGSIFSAIDAGHLTLAQYSQSPYIGAGLENFTPQDIAYKILGHPPADLRINDPALSPAPFSQELPPEERAAS